MGPGPIVVEKNGKDEDEATATGKAARSETKYPYYSLTKMIEFVTAVRRAGGSEAPDSDVMRELNLSQKTERLWGYGVPAATYFGLIERVGRGDEGRIKLTELANRIALPGTPEEARAAKVAAVLKPELYAKLLERFAGHPVPSRDGLKNILHRDYKIVESMAPIAADAFLESIKEAGLVTADNVVLSPTQPPHTAEMGKPPPRKIDDEPKGGETIVVPPGFVSHRFTLRRNMVVTLPLPEDLTAKDVERLSKWLATLPLDEEGA